MLANWESARMDYANIYFKLPNIKTENKLASFSWLFNKADRRPQIKKLANFCQEICVAVPLWTSDEAWIDRGKKKKEARNLLRQILFCTAGFLLWAVVHEGKSWELSSYWNVYLSVCSSVCMSCLSVSCPFSHEMAICGFYRKQAGRYAGRQAGS